MQSLLLNLYSLTITLVTSCFCSLFLSSVPPSSSLSLYTENHTQNTLFAAKVTYNLLIQKANRVFMSSRLLQPYIQEKV